MRLLWTIALCPSTKYHLCGPFRATHFRRAATAWTAISTMCIGEDMKKTGFVSKPGATTAPAVFIICASVLGAVARAQTPPLGAPSITAAAKGPDQINLTWPAVPNPGYGYLVEIQSGGDSRYSSWQELRPIPAAGGYTCDNTIVLRNGRCNVSDPSGAHVYNPPGNGIPYWVTEANYIDPQDGSPAQFIAWGLKPNTSYNFRVRSYSGNGSPVYSAYSKIASAPTAKYVMRYVSPAGNDKNAGDAADDSHAWRTLAHAAGAIGCGQVLMVKGGSYANDSINMNQACSAGSKAVVMVSPGEKGAITSVPAGAEHTVVLSGSHLVIDGLISASSSAQNNDYDMLINGNHNALLNVETHPAVVPALKSGVQVHGDHNLLYGSYLHDAGSPDATQNPGGNGGFVLTLEAASANGNVIWSNHLTRGGHDVSLCIRGCNNNRWLNNIMDGGWGMGWEAIQGSQHNLVEGNFIKDVGQLVTFYKPSIEVSDSYNTVRRNISVNAKSWALEVSALYGGSTAANTLIYNNVFYNPTGCFFQSHNGGAPAYDNDLYANNICYKFSNNATDIYQGNKKSKIIYNDILAADSTGTPQPDKKIIIWNHEAQADFQYPQTLAHADTTYSPPFSHNKGLDVAPAFVDGAAFDFHLTAGSALVGAGTKIADKDWGPVTGTVDLGAFGISPSAHTAAAVPGKPPAAAETNPTGSVNAPAIAGNVLRIGKPELDRATVMSLGIKLPVDGDDNFNGAVTVRYREAGTKVWRTALPLFRVHPEVVTTLPLVPQFAGSIFDLKPATAYEVELHATDPDGKVDQTISVTGSTRALPADPGMPRQKPVHNAQELTSALEAAQPGDIITLADGVYRGEFRLNTAGTADNPIVIRGASQEGAVLDGGGCIDCNVLEVYGAGFIHVERLSIRSAQRAIRFETRESEGNVVRRVHTRDTTLGIGSNYGQKDFYICDNILEGRLKWPLVYPNDNGSHSNDDGIRVQGFGHVVCHNRISGFGDAMKTEQDGARAVDFYGNDILYSYDNGIELDGGEGNVRCFRNRFMNTWDALSVQPIFGGPAYIFRNIVINAIDEQMKFHGGGNPLQEPAGILAFHNTFVSPGAALNLQTPVMSHYFIVANNLFVGPKSVGLKVSVNWDGRINHGIFDYNGYFPDGLFRFILEPRRTRTFPTLAVLQNAGIEAHGVALSQPIFQNGISAETSGVSAAPADASLAPNSAAIDRGLPLPNINDDFTGSAPDLGALEAGCPLPIFGPRPEGIDESNEPLGCPHPLPQSGAAPASAYEPAMLLWSYRMGAMPASTDSARAPREIAEQALLSVAAGDVPDALGRFNVSNFPHDKQEDAVREAYIEAQLQRVLALAASGNCAGADQGISTLGYDDRNLPFTFNGFGAFMKRLRFQYLMGTVDLKCGETTWARKRIEKVAKATADVSSPDYAYPVLAIATLDPTAGKAKAASALKLVARAIETAQPTGRGVLFYSRGLLQLLLGEMEDASDSFRSGAQASAGMLRYLNLEAWRTMESPQF
jgi:hypothetical protein